MLRLCCQTFSTLALLGLTAWCLPAAAQQPAATYPETIRPPVHDNPPAPPAATHAAVQLAAAPTVSTPHAAAGPASVQQVQAVAPAELHVANLPAQPGPPPSDGQLGPPAALDNLPPQAGPPFQLSPVEQQFVDQILQMWETESDKIKTFDCQFERWEYDPVFGPGNQIPFIKSLGQLTYAKPDKGSFKINEVRRYQQDDPKQPGDWVLQQHEVGEHWVCDGKAIHEYNHEKKQLVVQPLPPELQGTAIVDGPLPFLFGAKADKLKQRYWIRSPASNATSIQLEAYPRRQADAANYSRVDVMLDRKRMLPTALQVHMPNGQSRTAYMFQEPTINGKLNALFGSLFNAPRTPLGWKRVVEELPPATSSSPQAVAPQTKRHL